jgi:hypothetical protein
MDKSALTTVEMKPAEKPNRPRNPHLERRRTNRFCTELLVQLYWRDDKGRVLDGPGVIRNISADGFGLEFNQNLAVDQLVTVRTAAASLECVVRHAKLGSKKFLIGLQVLPSSRFSLKVLEVLSAALRASQVKTPELDCS